MRFFKCSEQSIINSNDLEAIITHLTALIKCFKNKLIKKTYRVFSNVWLSLFSNLKNLKQLSKN